MIIKTRKVLYLDVMNIKVWPIPLTHFYHDVLVKERVNRYEYAKAEWDLICKGFKTLSLLPESPVSEYDLDSEFYDDLPAASKKGNYLEPNGTNLCGILSWSL